MGAPSLVLRPSLSGANIWMGKVAAKLDHQAIYAQGLFPRNQQ